MGTLSILLSKMRAWCLGLVSPHGSPAWIVYRLLSDQYVYMEQLHECDPNAVMVLWAQQSPDTVLTSRQRQMISLLQSLHYKKIDWEQICCTLARAQKWQALASLITQWNKEQSHPKVLAAVLALIADPPQASRPALRLLAMETARHINQFFRVKKFQSQSKTGLPTTKLVARPGQARLAAALFDTRLHRFELDQALTDLTRYMDVYDPVVFECPQFYGITQKIRFRLARPPKLCSQSSSDMLQTHYRNFDVRLRRYELSQRVVVAPRQLCQAPQL